MNLTPFEDLLKQAIGLDAGSIGVSAVERAVRIRALICDDGDRDAYLERVRSLPAELEALIDAVVVPETWFFRDRGAFAALAGIARANWAGGRGVRLLSFPCATGEEPYSIAMTLIDSGIPRERFRVDAFDVSARLIERATAGLFSKNSFRGADLGFRDRHFERDRDGYRLNEMIRSAVNFRRGNLLYPATTGHLLPYDVVFCRNLLIYFDAATQERAVGILKRLVRADGYLFVGSSEANLIRGHGFEAVKAPLAFAFCKRAAVAVTAPVIAETKPLPRQSSSRSPITPVADRASRPFAGQSLFRRDSPGAKQKPAAASDSDLAEIERLADAGHLAEAARRCEAHLGIAGPSADALVLLAVIRDAAGNASEAIELYRKALYLDPHYEPALAHLRLRLAEQGDEAGARRLDDRIRRVAERRAK